METMSQQVAPSAAKEGITPTCNKYKRKVVDIVKVEQSCKLKQIHLWWKKLWILRLWGNIVTRGSREGNEREMENELQVMKSKLKEEQELDRQEKELQQEHAQ